MPPLLAAGGHPRRRQNLRPRRIRMLRRRIIRVLCVLFVTCCAVFSLFITRLANPSKIDQQQLINPASTPDPSKYQTRLPRFHLLVPENENRNQQLCKTILTSAMLQYPPPTLISNGAQLRLQRVAKSKADVHGISEYLSGREVQDDDMVLIAEDDVWFQLRSTVMINRFIHEMHEASLRSIEKYGPITSTEKKSPIYPPKVLFGAQKSCEHILTKNTACRPIPESILVADDNSEKKDKAKDVKNNWPRYLNSGMVMGRAVDLRPLYKKADEMMTQSGKSTAQDIFTEIFGRQEYSRRVSSEAAKSWISNILIVEGGYDQVLLPVVPGHGEPEANYEFGIEVDHTSSIFQVLDNSEEDIRFMAYASEFGKEKFHLPADLADAQRPFFRQRIRRPQPPVPMIEKIDKIPDGDWSSVKLAVNVAVPNSSVPSALSFRDREELVDSWWKQMWFQNSSRALLANVHQLPLDNIPSVEADEGGHMWWERRGGKAGGVWASAGDWREWDQVCGPHYSSVFADIRGPFRIEYDPAPTPEPVANQNP